MLLTKFQQFWLSEVWMALDLQGSIGETGRGTKSDSSNQMRFTSSFKKFFPKTWLNNNNIHLILHLISRSFSLIVHSCFYQNNSERSTVQFLYASYHLLNHFLKFLTQKCQDKHTLKPIWASWDSSTKNESLKTEACEHY